MKVKLYAINVRGEIYVSSHFGITLLVEAHFPGSWRLAAPHEGGAPYPTRFNPCNAAFSELFGKLDNYEYMELLVEVV